MPARMPEKMSEYMPASTWNITAGLLPGGRSGGMSDQEDLPESMSMADRKYGRQEVWQTECHIYIYTFIWIYYVYLCSYLYIFLDIYISLFIYIYICMYLSMFILCLVCDLFTYIFVWSISIFFLFAQKYTCHIYIQTVRQKLCPNSVSGWGSLKWSLSGDQLPTSKTYNVGEWWLNQV